ncbi:MAG: glycosyltransferase family 2 protein [Bacilli bacterium]|nr:glycosyltransferase family 2 protein [Bacilli bacterium]
MPKISIIVPIYNASKYLNKCIDSLINQTFDDIEIILINDGSIDDSEVIIKSYNDKRIRYFKNKNQGIGKTRNFGIDKAKGEYLMFVDSDDYISFDACYKFFSFMSDNNLDLAVSDFYKDIDGKLEKVNILDFQNASLSENSNLLLDINLGPCNKMYKTSLIKDNNIKFVENLKYEDAPFVVECLKKANNIGKVNEYLSFYCIHGNSETTVRDKRIFDIIDIVKMIRQSLRDCSFLSEKVDMLTVRILTNYTVQQRYQKNKNIRNKFIEECFMYLRKYVSDYKDNKYYTNRGLIKRTIEKSEFFTKLYCSLYNIFKF